MIFTTRYAGLESKSAAFSFMCSHCHCWTVTWWTASATDALLCPKKGKWPFQVLHSGVTSLTAGGADLSGKPYYFCLTERPHREGQSEAPVSVPHLRTTAPYLQLLCPVMCQICGGEERGASLCSSLFSFHHILPLFFCLSVVFSLVNFHSSLN